MQVTDSLLIAIDIISSNWKIATKEAFNIRDPNEHRTPGSNRAGFVNKQAWDVVALKCLPEILDWLMTMDARGAEGKRERRQCDYVSRLCQDLAFCAAGQFNPSWQTGKMCWCLICRRVTHNTEAFYRPGYTLLECVSWRRKSSVA